MSKDNREILGYVSVGNRNCVLLEEPTTAQTYGISRDHSLTYGTSAEAIAGATQSLTRVLSSFRSASASYAFTEHDRITSNS